MNRLCRIASLAVAVCTLPGAGIALGATSDVSFTSHDGLPMRGRLTLPDTPGPHPVVVYVQTAEGMTADMNRPGPNGPVSYFGLYRTLLAEKHIGFFGYEGRGVTGGDAPPRYETIDRPVFNTSSLENKVRDLLSAVDAVAKQPGVAPRQIFVIGASEGTLIAAEAAAREPAKVRGLALYGVLAVPMDETFKFILTDGGFLAYRGFFDTDKDGVISREEFERDPRRYRAQVFRNAPFETFDKDGSGTFDAIDMRLLMKPLLDAVDSRNYEPLNQWTRTAAGVATPDNWFKDHFEHADIWTFLSKLSMPVGLFHGDLDTNTPVTATRRLEQRAKEAGQSNLTFYYFADLDHSLGIGAYLFGRGSLPAGHQAILDFIARNVR